MSKIRHLPGGLDQTGVERIWRGLGGALEQRPLSEDEERVLRLIVRHDLEAETFLGQLPLSRVTRSWIEGLPSVDIEVWGSPEIVDTVYAAIATRDKPTS